MSELTHQTLGGIYALARMYMESGFYTPAERIFAGLVEIDQGATPAALGLAYTKFQREKYQEAIAIYKSLAQSGIYTYEARVGLACCFIATGERPRARTILEDQLRNLAQAPTGTGEIAQGLLTLA
jgi:lipopolysaccharide biosynthesis regulator YciM